MQNRSLVLISVWTSDEDKFRGKCHVLVSMQFSLLYSLAYHSPVENS